MKRFNADWGPMVVVGENESLESAIKRFKKIVDDERIIKDYKEKQYFIKPCQKRRLKRKEAQRKAMPRKSTKETYDR
jgi:small subunit ribosomal protein S21